MKLFFRLQLIFIVIVIIGFAAASSAQDIRWHAANGVDFSRFKTYKWQKAEKANYDDPLVNRILQTTIGEQLAAKGLTETQGDPDVYVVFQMAVAQDVEWSSFTTDVPYVVGAYDMVGYGGATTNSSEIIRRGWLMIDMYDIRDKKLVWQANVVKTLGKGKDPKKMESNARKVLAKVFKNYPRGPQK